VTDVNRLTAGEDHVLGEDGEFHAKDAPVELPASYPFEGWLSLAMFWLLALTVFYQFFTRYVMNDSAAWTEEISRYMLICVVFVGAAVAVRKNNHIQVDYFYRLMPPAMGRVASVAVDLMRIVFLGFAVVMTLQLMLKMGDYRMTIVDLPVNIVYGVCMFGFACMLFRSLQVLRDHWRQGYSVLERPETGMEGAP
jgi:TRAP-type C4-dicarboxylate transport system permease small subunit